MPDCTHLVLADDHPIVRQGFRRIIEMDETFRIIGEAGDGADALALIREKRPHIAVLDIAMPGYGGLEIAAKLRDEASPTRIVVLTMFRDREYFDEAMALGITGYILKDCAAADLRHCLHAVRKGEHYLSPKLSGYLVTPKTAPPPPETRMLLDRLTQSEKRVLQLMSDNLTSKEIADELFISYRTVQNHRANMCRKLELKGHHKLLHFAVKHKKYF